MNASRRQILRFGSLGVAAAGPASFFDEMGTAQEPSRIEASALISPGARVAGEASDTKRLQRAIAAAHERGGGTVHVASGRYVSGSLLLRSNVSLWLDNG